MLSIPLTRYVLTAAIRDRLIPVLLIVMILGAAVSVFLGSAAIIEANRFAMVFAAGSLRFIGVLGLVLFVVFFIRRSFENKDVEYLLSRPISRVSFILSHSLAFSLLASVTAIVATLAVSTLMPHFSLTSGGFLWGVSLIVEFVIMVNAALFFSMVLPSATTGVLATLGLYVLARMMGELLGIIYSAGFSGIFKAMVVAMQGISLIIPRLDLMAQTSWLVYGDPDIHIGFILLQAAAYIPLLLAATLIDLSRRQF